MPDTTGSQEQTKSRSSIKFKASLKEIKQDSEGAWTVRLEVSQTEAVAIFALACHTLKSLDIDVTPPEREVIHGELQE